MARPRLHLIRFHGVLAQNARLRPRVVPPGPLDRTQTGSEAAAAGDRDLDTVPTGPHRISWARLLMRVFDIDMQHCPNCGGGELKIIAAILRGEPGWAVSDMRMRICRSIWIPLQGTGAAAAAWRFASPAPPSCPAVFSSR